MAAYLKVFGLYSLIFVMVAQKTPAQSYPKDTVYSLEMLQRFLKTYTDKNDALGLGISHQLLASYYETQYGINKLSIEHLQKALQNYQLSQDSIRLHRTYLLLGDAYIRDRFMNPYTLAYYKKAQIFFEKKQMWSDAHAAEIRTIDLMNDAVKAIGRLETLEQKIIKRESYQELPRLYNLFAKYYLKLKDLPTALTFVRKSMDSNRTLRVVWISTLNLYYLGIIHQYQGNLSKATKYFKTCEAVTVRSQDYSFLKDIYRHLSLTYRSKSQLDSALFYANREKDEIDRFYNSELTKTIRLAELNATVENLSLRNEIQKQTQGKQQQLVIFFVLLNIALLGGVVAINRFRVQQKKINNQQIQLSVQKINDLEMEALQALVKGQEQERTRVAQDLHDSLGAMLSNIKLWVSKNELELGDHLDFVQQLKQQIDDSCHEVRTIANNLHPNLLEEFGLIAALGELIQKTQKTTQVVINYYTDTNFSSIHLTSDQVYTAYRIVQELLNNALKYSQAAEISVQLIRQSDEWMLSVEDNGVGFDTTQTTRGHGLTNIKARAQYLGGQFLLHSTPQKGTFASVLVPVAY